MKNTLKCFAIQKNSLDTSFHLPVMVREVIDFFFQPIEKLKNHPPNNKGDIVKPYFFIDATVGGGGHLFAIVGHIKKNYPDLFNDCVFIAIDTDPDACAFVLDIKNRLKIDNLFVVWDNYVNISVISSRFGIEKVDRILFDLGLSLHQAKSEKKGFSYTVNGLLDMRFDPINQKVTALDIIRDSSYAELEKILKEYGEEPFYKKIAKRIFKEKNNIETTTDLKKIILKAAPNKKSLKRGFQALRIATNDELNKFSSALKESFSLLRKYGRLLVISYHSLEDRIVKQFFLNQKQQKKGIILTPHPIRPNKEEIKGNPSAKSAKLRAFLKLEE